MLIPSLPSFYACLRANCEPCSHYINCHPTLTLSLLHTTLRAPPIGLKLIIDEMGEAFSSRAPSNAHASSPPPILPLPFSILAMATRTVIQSFKMLARAAGKVSNVVIVVLSCSGLHLNVSVTMLCFNGRPWIFL